MRLEGCNTAPLCEGRTPGGGRGAVIRYEAPSITFEGLADLAVIAGSNSLDLAVVDMTGLKGRYQVNLDVSMADLYAAISEGPREQATVQNAQLKVVQDALKKLGLQLEPRKAPVGTVIIDHLEKTPTAN
ncbi:MAG TPA: TIGR03435 family protein [Bryobacteraceae bacterium]